MKWYCHNCGRKNDHQVNKNCSKCGLDQETATTMAVSRRRATCEECGHKHHEGVFCHVYTEAGDADLINDPDVIEEDEEEDEEEEEEEEEDLPLRVRTANAHSLTKSTAKPAKRRPLSTPAHIRAAGLIRCNCDVGVPNDSVKYEPLPKIIQVGKIQLQTYFELCDPVDKARFEESLHLKYGTVEASVRLKRESQEQFCQLLSLVLPYLPHGQCSEVPKVCRLWNYGTNLYKEYIDIRNCVPWQVFRPHVKQVDSVLVHKQFVYSGGDHCVLASQILNGEILSVVMRDSGDITKLFLKNDELYVCSSNGSVRSYALTHTGKGLQLTATMWDHTRAVADLLPSLPSHGPCDVHSIDNHVCFLYTASEDRTVKMWDTNKLQLSRTIFSNALRSCTFLRLAQSNRHLFVASSLASIAVFTKYDFCEREDVHVCQIPNADRAFCLQISLKLPRNKLTSGNPPWITGLLCPPIGPEFPSLWASDSAGHITIWHVPSIGLDFTPAHTVQAHNGAINQISNTWRHVISIGEDGWLILHDIVSFARIRSIDVMLWSVEKNLLSNPHIHRKLKSINIQENYNEGGQMVVGTSYGDVICFNIGTTV